EAMSASPATEMTTSPSRRAMSTVRPEPIGPKLEDPRWPLPGGQELRPHQLSSIDQVPPPPEGDRVDQVQAPTAATVDTGLAAARERRAPVTDNDAKARALPAQRHGERRRPVEEGVGG